MTDSVKKFVIRALITLPLVGLIFYSGYRLGVFANDFTKYDEKVAADWGTIVSGTTSLIAVILIYITYKSQQIELRETQRALKLQKADNAFFNMLTMLETIVSSIEKELDVVDQQTGASHRRILKSRIYLREAFSQLKDKLRIPNYTFKYNETTSTFDQYQITLQDTEVRTNLSINAGEFQEIVQAPATNFFHDKGDVLSHYFRYFEAIVDFITAEFNELDRPMKLKTLNAQLSNDELGLLLYYSITIGKQRLLTKLCNYSLLKNLNSSTLQNSNHIFFYLLKIPRISDQNNV
ncbi:MAG: putative phage abortive infection protein [Cyclobacteriaceae bacterium]|jgi:hypothetical protein